METSPESSTEASTNETGTDGGPDGEVNCNVDLTMQCYPCTPTVTEQFLNGCTDGTCVPFDKTRLKGLISDDGGLPPLDGG